MAYSNLAIQAKVSYDPFSAVTSTTRFLAPFSLTLSTSSSVKSVKLRTLILSSKLFESVTEPLHTSATCSSLSLPTSYELFLKVSFSMIVLWYSTFVFRYSSLYHLFSLEVLQQSTRSLECRVSSHTLFSLESLTYLDFHLTVYASLWLLPASVAA